MPKFQISFLSDTKEKVKKREPSAAKAASDAGHDEEGRQNSSSALFQQYLCETTFTLQKHQHFTRPTDTSRSTLSTSSRSSTS